MSRISQSVLAVLPLTFAARRGAPRLMVIALLASLVPLNAHIAVAQALVEYGHIISSATANATNLNKKIDSGLSQKIDTDLTKKIDSNSTKKTDSALSPDNKPAPAAPAAEVPEVANRQALEQKAGKDAAKLTLKSVPSKAIVRIDGKSVGQTPVLLTLAPGNYKVEMEGPRMELGWQQVNLVPQETREVELSLSQPPRYPAQIRLP